MLASGVLVGGRFRVLRTFAPTSSSAALADALNGTGQYWLVQVPVAVTEAQLGAALERHVRFALGVPGLARPVAFGVDAGGAFLAYRAPSAGSALDAHLAPWAPERVSALATRLAAALGPLHEQGIAHGYLLPELVSEAESDAGDALFGFGVAHVATLFGAAGEASQLLPPESRAPELRAALVAPTPASDVFALSVLLRALLSEPGAALSDGSASPPLSPELSAVLARGLASDPRARPHDVCAFAADFERAARVPSPAVTAPAPVVPAPAPVQALPEAPIALGASLPPALPPPPVLPLESAFGPRTSPQPLVPPLFAPQSQSSNSGLIALLVVGLGFVLMLGGVAGAFVYATRRAAALARAVAVAPPSPSTPAIPTPPPLAPPVPTPPATEDALPPGLPAPEAEAEPELRRPPHPHAPMVAPGVGPSSFPEEARVALPVLGNEPIWGTRNAPLTWVFFGDLDCPHTRRAWRALEAAKLSFGDDLRIVFRHRPLREHPNAREAAQVLAGLARRRGSQAFFDVLHRAVQGDESMSSERLTALLGAAGFGDLKLSELSALGAPAVLADQQLAGQFAVRSTPYSFLNGQAVDGARSLPELEQLLHDEQRTATWLAASGLAAGALYATRTTSNLTGVGDTAESRACVPIGHAPTRGPAEALVTLVEFSDFECQYCRRVEPTLQTLLKRYPRALRVVWKDYPLPQHKNALLLANFAADAYRRGSSSGFWAVHDGLFASSEALDDGALGVLAGKAGLDGALLLISAHNGVHDASIRSDMKLGAQLGVSGTPTFFANGRRIQGALPLEQFDTLIREELQVAQRIVARGVPARDLYGLVCD